MNGKSLGAMISWQSKYPIYLIRLETLKSEVLFEEDAECTFYPEINKKNVISQRIYKPLDIHTKHFLDRVNKAKIIKENTNKILNPDYSINFK